jgi:hypothetical protein
MSIVLLRVPILAALIPNQEIFSAYLLWGDAFEPVVFMGNKLPTTWLITLMPPARLMAATVFYRWYGKRRSEPDGRQDGDRLPRHCRGNAAFMPPPPPSHTAARSGCSGRWRSNHQFDRL